MGEDSRRATLSDVFAAARDPDLSAEEVRLWVLYRSYEQPDGRGAYPGDDLLAGRMGCSERSVQRYRAALLEKGYLVRRRRGPKPAFHWAVVPGEESPPVANQSPERDDTRGESSGERDDTAGETSPDRDDTRGESTEDSPSDSPKDSPLVSPEYGEYGEKQQSGEGRGDGGAPVLDLSSPDAVEGGEGEDGSDGGSWPSPSEAVADEYPDAFEETWAAYPRREGSNPKKGAYRRWLARVRAGADPAELLEAARCYAGRCDAEDRTGTRYVKQAATFFGPDEHWREFLGNGRPGERETAREAYDRTRGALAALDRAMDGEDAEAADG